MKKKLFLMILTLLSIITSLSVQTFAYVASDWTKNTEDNYFYYKELSLNYTTALDVKIDAPGTIEYYNWKASQWVESDQYELTIDIVPSQANGMIAPFWILRNFSGSEVFSAQSTAIGVIPPNPRFRYKEDTVIVFPEEPTHTVDDLPQTSGNPFVSTGTMAPVDFELNGYLLKISIVYNGIPYYLEKTLASDTDLVPFQFNNAFYYTHENSKIIIMNHHESESMFYGNSTQDFIAYTAWELKTDVIRTTDRLTTYVHMDAVKNSRGSWSLFGYFYLDDYIIDDLVDITVSYYYRFKYPWPFSDGNYRHVKTTLDNETQRASINYPWIRYLTMGYAFKTRGDVDRILESKIDEIEKLNVSTMDPGLLNEIDSGYSKANQSFEGVKSTMDIYKLFFDVYTHSGANGFDVYTNPANQNDEKNFAVISFTYIKNDKLITINAKNIQLHYSGGNTVPIKEVPWWEKALDWIFSTLEIIYVVAWGLIGFKYKLFKNTKSTVLYVIFGVIVAFLFGIIRI